jgi:hypothetical protein
MRWISVGLAVASRVALFRQHWLHVGATPDERRQSLPGDELLAAWHRRASGDGAVYPPSG